MVFTVKAIVGNHKNNPEEEDRMIVNKEINNSK